MVSFADARHVVEDDAPDVQTAAYGYESDEHWFPVVLPERVGGRVPAVSKASGELTWVSSTTSDEYSEAQLCGAPRPVAAIRARELDLLGVTRALGHDVTPGHDELHHYWTRDPRGLAKWVDHPKPWTALFHHLEKFVGPERAKRMAAEWFHERFGFWPGSDLNRVTHGKPPRGHRVGPG